MRNEGNTRTDKSGYQMQWIVTYSILSCFATHGMEKPIDLLYVKKHLFSVDGVARAAQTLQKILHDCGKLLEKVRN